MEKNPSGPGFIRVSRRTRNIHSERCVQDTGFASGAAAPAQHVETKQPSAKDVQAWLGISGFYRGYLRNYVQRTVAMRHCLEVCRLDENRTQLGAAWNVAREAEREDIFKLLQCSRCGALAHP